MPERTEQVFSRFYGGRGKTLAIEALREQKIVLGNIEAAEELFTAGCIRCFHEAECLMRESDWSNYIIFILAGTAEIVITGFKVAERKAGQHVGEMALIDPSQPRSASVIASEPTVGLSVSEENFTVVAARHPTMWRQIAKEIADRLRQRKKFIRQSNPVPVIFVACAAEALPVAEALKAFFGGYDVVVEIWTDGVFKPSQGTMESLEAKLEVADFAVAIFSADDEVTSRGEQKEAPRDNTVFELGLFAGAIGRERSFFVVQDGTNLKVPTDLAGITSLRFRLMDREGGAPNVTEACAQIEGRIAELGPR